MKLIDIKGTNDTPAIILDSKELFFEISGISKPENIRNYYHVLQTTEDFLKKLVDNPPYHDYSFKFKFKMQYFNSSSAKLIADIFLLADEYAKKNCNIKLLWYLDEDDDDMLEAGEYYEEMVDTPVKFITVKEN